MLRLFRTSLLNKSKQLMNHHELVAKAKNTRKTPWKTHIPPSAWVTGCVLSLHHSSLDLPPDTIAPRRRQKVMFNVEKLSQKVIFCFSLAWKRPHVRTIKTPNTNPTEFTIATIALKDSISSTEDMVPSHGMEQFVGKMVSVFGSSGTTRGNGHCGIDIFFVLVLVRVHSSRDVNNNSYTTLEHSLDTSLPPCSVAT